MEPKQLIIVAVKGKMHQQVFGPACAKLCGFKKSELQKSGNWKGYTFQLRNQQAYKKMPILIKKIKPLTYEEKKAA